MDKVQEPTFSVSPFSVPAPSSPVTTAAVTNKFVLLGLANGALTLYDVFGNLVDSHPHVHTSSVTALSLDAGLAHDEVVASAASTSLRVASLCTSNSTHHATILSDATVRFNRTTSSPICAIAVDPNFGKPRYGDRVAYADQQGRLTIFTSAWFGGGDHVVRQPSASPIHSIAWFHHLLAYATIDGVLVHDTRTQRPVCRLAPPGQSNPTSPLPSYSVFPPKSPPETTITSPSHQRPTSPSTPLSSKPPSSPAKHGLFSSSGSIWDLRTKLSMQEHPTAPLSSHNEATVLLYVAWPSGARIIQIGPHKDLLTKENVPLRDITVIFRLERRSIPLTEIYTDKDSYPLDTSSFLPDQSPILSMVPFGAKEHAVLLGTPSKELVMLLVNDDGISQKSMTMPVKDLRNADLLPIPGGDPLTLIVGHSASTSSDLQSQDAYRSPCNQNLLYVRPLTTAERVKWLLGQGRFSDALKIAQSAPGGSLRREEVSLEEIGEQFLESLYDANDFEHLASVLPETIVTTTPYTGLRAREKVMAKRMRRWDRWIGSFRKSDKLAILAPSIPTYAPCLNKDTYNSILVELCKRDPEVMLHVLKTWPADVFGVSTVTKAIEEQLAKADEQQSGDVAGRESLREGLLMMYGLSGRHDENLNLLLREESPKVYDYIRSHHLYEAVRAPETISGLYKIDSDAATEMLSRAPETVLPPEAVVPIMTKLDNSEWTFMYLNAVFKLDVDHAPKYHNLLLKLYVDHGSAGMLFNFLRTSTHYSLDRALQEMGGPKGVTPGHLARERVYVLAAMGDLNSAMEILLNELGDTFAAIEFASDHGDTVLWERLIEHAGTHADTLAALLDSPAGGKVDPVRLIPLLNSEMRIPYLRDRLHRILVDAALERALREDAAAALHHDASELLRQLDESVSLLPS